jgi:hypothetical protein
LPASAWGGGEKLLHWLNSDHTLRRVSLDIAFESKCDDLALAVSDLSHIGL